MAYYWKHVKSGDVYEITGFGLNEKDLTPEVEYRRADGTGPTWHRACTDFFDGRFRQVDNDPDPFEEDEPDLSDPPEQVATPNTESGVEKVFETNAYSDTFGVIRVENWPDGTCLWVGGEIVWKSWAARKVSGRRIGDRRLRVSYHLVVSFSVESRNYRLVCNMSGAAKLVLLNALNMIIWDSEMF